MPIYSFIHADEGGMIIHPFETNNVENLNGKYLSNLLLYELHNLEDIGDMRAEKYPLEPLDEYIISKNFTHGFNYSIMNEKDHKIKETLYFSSKYNQNFAIPSIPFKSDDLSAMFSQLGTVSVEGTSIPLGNLFLILGQTNGCDLNCSIQKEGSSIVMIAILENHTAKEIRVWEVIEDLNKSNQSVEQVVPLMIKDIVFEIAYELGMENRKKGEEYPQTWQTFKNIVDGSDAYSKYLLTKDSSYLDSASERALDVLHNESANNWSNDILFNIGIEYIRKGKYNESREIFQSISDRKPFESAMGMGMSEYMVKKYSESVNNFSKAILLNNSSYAAWYDKGISLRYLAYIDTSGHKEDDIKESIDAFDNASKCNGANQMKSQAFLAKGKTIEMLDYENYLPRLKFEDALDAYNESVKKDASNVEAHFGKGRMLYFIGKRDSNNRRFIEAEKAFNDAIDLDPLNAEYHNGKANALFAQGRKKLNASLLEYENAIILDPDLAAAYCGKGNVLFELSDFKGALEAYNVAIEKDPTNELYNQKVKETNKKILWQKNQ